MNIRSGSFFGLRITRSTNNPALALFALFTVFATVALIGIGGLVTSHGVGMAVPDWPTTYGYNMFAFPFSYWVGGIFYEHSHRLVASVVGFLTMTLAAWLWLKEERRWLRWLGVIAFVAVVVQGILGGLRVTLIKQELGIFHATLAQLFLLLLAAIAFFLSKSWARLTARRQSVPLHSAFRPLVFFSTAAILFQLILGATMRHQHAGLAVPDFPLAYGELWPSTDPEFIREVNAKRLDSREFNPITPAQIHLHMAHRLTALLIFSFVAGCAVLVRKTAAGRGHLRKFVDGWMVLILIQAGLGAYTVWSNKAADIATAHVLVGALSLVWGGLLGIAASVVGFPVRASADDSVPAGRPVLTS